MQTLVDYISQGELLSVPDGSLIFAPGDETRAFLIVTEGVVRVEQTNNAGRTVVLYRVEAGDSCVLTTTCLLSDRPYSGFGYADGDVKAIAITPTKFRNLLRSDNCFQELVFRSFAQRVGELTDVIDDLLEHRTDLRLARWLAKANASEIKMKQHEIAQELGTAREVVSRALKAFEERGWIKIGRGNVTVLDRDALRTHGVQVNV
ncbi:MAG: Crp/Fnr family transcriptional regulator [Tateyamaria sp.]|uniref:Crp/Fnr family transcriptional regulator n=1 Tax=Tateyamaria sp. TaxID=1929288 RepID=UPI00329EC602